MGVRTPGWRPVRLWMGICDEITSAQTATPTAMIEMHAPRMKQVQGVDAPFPRERRVSLRGCGGTRADLRSTCVGRRTSRGGFPWGNGDTARAEVGRPSARYAPG